MTDITVITPSLPDRRLYRGEALNSVIRQTLQPKGHLISLDYDLRGPYELENEMMKGVTTEWFCFLPDDDLMHTNHLEVLAEKAEENPGTDLVYSEGRFFGKDAKARQESIYWGDFSKEDFYDKRDTGLRGGLFLMRTEVFLSLGGFTEGHLTPDWEFLCRFLDRKPLLCRVDEHTWDYRLHDSSLSAAIERFYAGESAGDLHYLKGML